MELIKFEKKFFEEITLVPWSFMACLDAWSSLSLYSVAALELYLTCASVVSQLCCLKKVD